MIAKETVVREMSDDPLMDALMLVSKHYGIPVSRDVLCAGLPLVGNRLTPELLVRAAERAGLKARLIERELGKIPNLVLPVLLLLNEGQASVLMSIDPKAREATLVSSETGEITVPLDKVEEAYTGRVFFLSREHRFDERSPELLEVRSRHWFWGTLTRSWRIYRDVLLASLMINLFALAGPLYIMNVYDRVVPNQAMETLWVLASGVFIVYLFDFVVRTLRGYFVDIAGKKSDVLLSASIFEQVMGMKRSSRPPSVGAFANNLRDFESIREFITSATITTLVDLPFVLIFLGTIAFVAGGVVWVPFVGIAVIGLYSKFIQGPLRDSIDKTVRASSQKHATLVEGLTAMETVKTLGMEGMLQNRWERMTGYIADWGIRSRLISASSTHVALLVQQLVQVGVIIAGVYGIAEGQLSMGGLVAAVILSSRAIAPMTHVASLATRYHHAKVALVSLSGVMNQPKEREPGEQRVHRGRLAGDIAFDQVSFSYPDEQHRSLSDVSFKIKAGERVGLLGKVGSGKTTLHKLILKLYEPDQGNIRIDGVDLRQIDPSELRRNIGYVDQQPTLFFGSLRENMIYARPRATDPEILAAAELSGVSGFAADHPSGFNLAVGERGERLSSGQRQTVAIARAVLGNSPILLMDEPSSALDQASENQLVKKLKPFFEGKTVLLVTHRTSLLGLVDRLIILDQGRVIADGPRERVLASLRKGKGHE
jgi:ATP-binding cassette subfamily C protein LapB